MSPTPTAKKDDDHSARATLRRDFLRALGRLRGRSCREVRLHSGFVSEDSTFLAFDRDFLHLCVENLSTPTGHTLGQAVLRATDVDSVTFKKQD